MANCIALLDTDDLLRNTYCRNFFKTGIFLVKEKRLKEQKGKA